MGNVQLSKSARVSRDDDEIERWHFADRYYGITLLSAVDHSDLELDDLGPAPGRGTVMTASRADDTGVTTVSVFTSEPLPLGLVEQFVDEARRRLPPNA